MSTATANHKNADAFAMAFPALQPLITAEWPEVDAKSLKAAAGDYDKVVAVVTSSTEHSKTLVKRHLAELVQLTHADARSAATGGSAVGGGALGATQRRIQSAIGALKARARELVDGLRQRALTSAKHGVQRHPFGALFFAIGLGVLVSVLLLGRKPRQPMPD